jgi:hypothetical protein
VCLCVSVHRVDRVVDGGGVAHLELGGTPGPQHPAGDFTVFISHFILSFIISTHFTLYFID